MLAVICTLAVGSIIYSSGTSFVRYLYVRSSLISNIQETLKRDSFIIKSLIIGESLSIFNLGSFYFLRQPMILNEACLNPGGNFTKPLYKVFPLNQFIMFLCTFTNIICNISLSFYLTEKSESNMAVTEVDKKKDRKRNLVPAKTGLWVFGIYILSMMVFLTTYGYKSEKLDSATRAFINAAYTDFTICISSPIIILLGSTDAKKKISHFWDCGLQILQNPFNAENNP